MYDAKDEVLLNLSYRCKSSSGQKVFGKYQFSVSTGIDAVNTTYNFNTTLKMVLKKHTTVLPKSYTVINQFYKKIFLWKSLLSIDILIDRYFDRMLVAKEKISQRL